MEIEELREKERAVLAPRTGKENFDSALARHRKIKARMAILGITGQDIANVLGTKRQNVWTVLSGRNKNPRYREVIAKMLGYSYVELWRD